MKENRLNLLNNLFKEYNKNEVGSPYFVLAKFFIDNYSQISELNIYDIAEGNNISRATVRRFCQYLGYRNFKEFKQSFNNFNDGKNRLSAFYTHENFEEYLLLQLISINKELTQRMQNLNKEYIVKEIYEAEEVYFYVSNRIRSSVQIFQQNMALFGKRITLIKDIHEWDPNSVSKNSLLIILSISGLMVTSSADIVCSVGCQKILFTLNRNLELDNQVDKVFYLSSEYNSENYILYYTYGINFLLDILFEEYIQRYNIE